MTKAEEWISMLENENPRSRADELRDAGLCVCGCGLKASRSTDPTSPGVLSGLPTGTRYSTGHNFKGTPSFNREQALANLATPASAVTPEMAPWRRAGEVALWATELRPFTVFTVSELATCCDVYERGKSPTSGITIPHGEGKDALRRYIDARWPQDAQPRSAVDAFRDMFHRASVAPSPHPCPECPELTTALLCESCDARRNGTIAAERKRCYECKAPGAQPDGLCGYCSHSTESGEVSRPWADDITRKATDSSTNEAGEAARQRIAAFERRTRHVKTATEKLLEKPHPWEEF